MRFFKQFSLAMLMLWSISVGVASAQGWTVKPGEGVGAISVGATPSALEAFLQSTRKIGPSTKPAFVEYTDALIIEFEANKAVTISLHKNTFPTRSGVVSWVPYRGAAIGTPWNTVVNQIQGRKLSRKLPTAKGYPDEYYHAYPDLGIGFRVKGGAIEQVDVWELR